MGTSRRKFLKAGTMGLLFAGIPAVLAKVAVGNPTLASGVRTANSQNQVDLAIETFTPYLNSKFLVRNGSSMVALKLKQVTDLKKAGKPGERIAGTTSFSLLFLRSSRAVHLTQDTYTLEHPALGKFSLFLVPVGESANRHHEAIIVRL